MCNLCDDGYLLKGGRCHLIEAENCAIIKTTKICTSCLLGFKYPDTNVKLRKSCS